MRFILSLIAALALVGTFLGLALPGVAIGSFTIFVVAGAGAAVLEVLFLLKVEAKRQTRLLEEIALNTRPATPPALKSPESAVVYKIPGING